MTGYRIVQGPLPQGNYTIVSNNWTRDKRLSWEARALLTWLIGHDPSFVINEQTIIEAGGAKRDKVRRMIAELERYGYLVRRRERGQKGQLAGVVYVITDPWTAEKPQVATNDGKSGVGEGAEGNGESKPQVGTNDGFPNVGSANVGPANVGPAPPIRRPTEEEKTSSEEDSSGLPAAGGLSRRNARDAAAPSAKTQDPLVAEAWRTFGALDRRYREGLPEELRFPMVAAIRQALVDGFGPAAVLAFARLAAPDDSYGRDKHLPLLRRALGMMRRDVKNGLACPTCGHDPDDQYGPQCERCRPDHAEPTEQDLADFAAAAAYLERGESA